MTNKVIGLLELKEIISNLKHELELYAQKENASISYIDKQNNLIILLVNVYNSLDSLKYYHSWCQIEQCMDSLSQRDPELSGVSIQFRTGNKNNNFGKIEFSSIT